MYVITGSSSGIGKNLYGLFVKNNIPVLGVDIKPDADYVCDVSSKKELKDLVLFLKENYEKIDGVVICAGVASNSRQILKINYFGAVNLLNLIYDYYNEINAVMVGSIMSVTSHKNFMVSKKILDSEEYDDELEEMLNNIKLTDASAYSTAKFSLTEWMKYFVNKNKFARINIIHPALVETGLVKDFLGSKVLEVIYGKRLVQEMMQPIDVAEILYFLITGAKVLNKQSILVDRGIV